MLEQKRSKVFEKIVVSGLFWSANYGIVNRKDTRT